MPSKLKKGETFQPLTIGKDNQGTFAALTNVEPYLQTLLQQPQIPEGYVNNTISFWITTVRPTIYQSNANLLSFSFKFNNFFPYLSDWAGDFANPTNFTNFSKGVECLAQGIDRNVADAQSSIDSLTDWNTHLAKHATRFSNELHKTVSGVTGDKEKIEKLLHRIEEVNKDAATDLADVALRSATEPFGGILISVGKLAEIGTTVIPVGGLVVLGGSISTNDALKRFLGKLPEKEALVTQLASLNAEIALAQSISYIFTYLAKVGEELKQEAAQLLATWKALQINFHATREALASASDGSFFQEELKASREEWRKVQISAKRIQHQLTDIPVKINLTRKYAAQSTPSAVRRATPLVRDANDLSIRARLANDETSGDVVRALVEVVAQLDADAKNMDSAIDVYGLKQDAQELAEEVNELIPKLEDLGTILADRLEALIQEEPLDVEAVQALFQETLVALEPVQNDTDTLVVHSNDLYFKSGDAVAESQAEVLDLTNQIAADQSEIQDLIEEINTIQQELAALEQVKKIVCTGLLVLFCPITDQIVNLTSNYYAKLAELNSAQERLNEKDKQLRNAEARRAQVQNFSQQALDLTNHVNKLTQILQILTTKFEAIANAASDEIVEEWAKEQAQDLIDALRELGKAERFSPLVALIEKPTDAFQNIIDATISKITGLKPKPRANPPSTLDSLSAISAANLNIHGATGVLVKQSVFTLTSVPQFSRQFEIARTHASQLQTQYADYILEILAQISSLGNLAVYFLKSASGSNPEHAVKSVQRILDQIGKTRAYIRRQANDLTNLFGVAYHDRAALYVLEEASFGTQTEEVEKIAQDIENLAKHIFETNSQLARNATAAVINDSTTPPIQVYYGSFIFGSQSIFTTNILSEKPKGEAPEDRANYTPKFSSEVGALRDTISKLASLQPNFALFHTTTSQVNGIVKAAIGVLNQLENLVAALDNEKVTLTALISSLQKNTQEDLSNALQHWQTIQSGIQKLLQFSASLSL
eukprot:Phypoly_transcript_00184.p1 GENE.Phypoly_transcript_00184~~Phypoly_transcript_00184.p1  ORF type:complete len:1001 (+),score=219.60 Phypoly_transcript_00184:3078-6080(+)